MNRFIILLAILFATIPFASDALARTHHHHRHHRHHHHHKRHPVVKTVQPARAPTSTGMAMLAEAERWVGSRNPTGFRGPWCGAFQAMVARKVGVEPPRGYLQARQWVNAGRRLSGPAIGAIAVLLRRGGGHVGVVAGVEPDGDPIIVSGNHNRRVGVGVYPKSRVLAYVEP